jgi:hypothetical protein
MTTPEPPLHASGTPWPTVAADPSGHAEFAHFHPVRRTDEGTSVLHTHRRMFILLLMGLVVASTALVIVVILLRPAPPQPCQYLFRCGGPSAFSPDENGTLYQNLDYGFRLYYAGQTAVSTNPNGITLSFNYNDGDAQGQVQIAAARADGRTASQIVTQVQQQLAANAVSQYAVPDPFIGYVPAVGEAYNFVVNGSSNAEIECRLIVLVAIDEGTAIVVVDSGPFWQFSDSNSAVMAVNGHPSPADQFAALFADPIVNSIRWPNQVVP